MDVESLSASAVRFAAKMFSHEEGDQSQGAEQGTQGTNLRYFFKKIKLFFCHLQLCSYLFRLWNYSDVNVMLFIECQIANATLFSLTWVCFIGRRLPSRPLPPRLPCRPERRQTQGQAGVPLQAVRGRRRRRRDIHVQVRRELSKKFWWFQETKAYDIRNWFFLHSIIVFEAT